MRFAALLGKALNIRPGEWRRLSLLYCMSLVALTGLMWSDAIVQAAFLQRVGVQYLPWIIIACASGSIVALFIYSAFADRISNTRILVGLLGLSAGGIVAGLVLLLAGLTGPAFVLLYLVMQVPLLDVYNIHWATYVNGFYDIRTAKRIVPVLSTTARVGGIVAGLSMPAMNRLLSPAAIVGIGAVSILITATLAALMPRWMREPRSIKRGKESAPGLGTGGQRQERRVQVRALAAGYAASLHEGYRQVADSPFLRWMALSTLCMAILLPLINYQVSAILQAQLKTTVGISNFTGLLSGAANVVLLPFQLFLLSRLIARLGLGNATLIFPFASLATAGSLVVAPGLGTAAVGYLDRTALRQAFRIPTENLLYNAVPQRVKARTRAFVSGLLAPVGAIVGGVLLLTPLMKTTWFLPAAMVTVAAAFAMAAWQVRKHYGPALIKLLAQEDYSSLALKAPTEQGGSLSVDPATLASLAQKLDVPASPERTLFLAQLLAAVGGEAAVPIIGQAARATANSRLRARLVEVLVAEGARTGAARELYEDLLADPEGSVRLAAIDGLEQIDGPADRRYLAVAARLLHDPEVAVRLRVLPALVGADDSEHHAAGTMELRALLASADVRVRARAIAVVGQVRGLEFLLELVRALTDRDDEVRLAAAVASESLACDAGLAGKRDLLLAVALLSLHDPIERARLAAVGVLDQLSMADGPGAPAAIASLAAGLADPSADVRARTVDALVRAGRRGLASAQEQLRSPDRNQRKMAAVVLARVDPHKHGAAVLDIILTGNLPAIYQNLAVLHALAGCPGPAAAVLQRALAERNDDLLEEIFYLLGAVKGAPAVALIARSMRSPLPDVRANAAEALESATTPQLAALVAPLLDPGRAPESALPVARQTFDLPASTLPAALSALLAGAGDAWLRTLAAAVLAELVAQAGPAGAELSELLSLACADPDAGVRGEAAAASRLGNGSSAPLTPVQRLAVLDGLPFFRPVRVDQLRTLANVCEEVAFATDTQIFCEGDAGDVLYALVRGRVAIEQERRKGSFARLTTVEAGSFLGESEFFDGNCRTYSALAIQDTVALKLGREPLIALARQQPELSLRLISVLGDRLREANERLAGLTHTEPERLSKLYEQLG